MKSDDRERDYGRACSIAFDAVNFEDESGGEPERPTAEIPFDRPPEPPQPTITPEDVLDVEPGDECPVCGATFTFPHETA